MLETIKSVTGVEIAYNLFATLVLVGALGTILSKKPMHSVMFLILTFFSLSGIYVLLNAQFVAVVNIIVYAGAIMVLFLFVLMFLNLRQDSNFLANKSMLLAAVISGGSLALLLVAVLRKAQLRPVNPETFKSDTGLIENLGTVLFKEYLLAFELVSVLFLVATVGAILLGKREKGENHF